VSRVATSSTYREELVSEDEFERGVALYGEQAVIPVKGGHRLLPGFVRSWQQPPNESMTASLSTSYLPIENGKVLKRLPRKPEPDGLLRLER
jgi:hypothetical protein